MRRLEIVAAEPDARRLTARYHWEYRQNAEAKSGFLALRPIDGYPKVLEIRIDGKVVQSEWPGLSIKLPADADNGAVDITVEWASPLTASFLPETVPLTILVGSPIPVPRISMRELRDDVRLVGFGLPGEDELLSASITQLSEYDTPLSLSSSFTLHWMTDPKVFTPEPLADVIRARILAVYGELSAGHDVHPRGGAIAMMGGYKSTHLWRSPSMLVFDWGWLKEDSSYREAFLAYQFASYWWGGLVRFGDRAGSTLQTALVILELERLDRSGASRGGATNHASEAIAAVARRVKNADRWYYAPWHGAVYDWLDRIKQWNPGPEQLAQALRRTAARWAGYEVGNDELADTLRD